MKLQYLLSNRSITLYFGCYVGGGRKFLLEIVNSRGYISIYIVAAEFCTVDIIENLWV